jgi:hypothetical protein
MIVLDGPNLSYKIRALGCTKMKVMESLYTNAAEEQVPIMVSRSPVQSSDLS